MRDLKISKRALTAYLLAVMVTSKGSDTSGNYGHRGVKNAPWGKGGSAPGGGHTAIGVGAEASKEEIRQAISEHQETQAKEKGQLGPYIRQRISKRYDRLKKELAQAQEVEKAATLELDANQAKAMYQFDRYLEYKNATTPEAIKMRDEFKKTYDDLMETGADLFETQIEALNRVVELKQQIRTNGIDSVAVPKSQQANVTMDTDIETGREEAQAGLDLFNRLVGTGTVDGEAVTVSRRNTNRACYTPLFFASDAGHVKLSQGDKRITMLHEMGHWLEDRDPAIHQKAITFLDKRTAGEEPQRLADLYPGHNYDQYEITKKDKFYHAYTGKLYESGTHGQYATEVISMGLQHLYENAYQFAKNDPDFFDFMIATLRGT